ncbi:MAG TPA: zinc transporter ZupT [Vicinamibacteria bacterium]|nr:zinc transporter ZupT [Vicinamibacteria bacterium]
MEWSPVAIAFALTLFAGLATGIGSALSLLAQRTNARFLSAALGFSAGVMIYVSFVEILADARVNLSAALGLRPGAWVAVLAFFGGMGLTALIDRLVPAAENPHEVHRVEEMHRRPDAHLMRMGLLSAVAIALHNFPEGIATFVAALDHPKLGVSIATAVAIHNVPEGIAVAVPVFYATGSRARAFTWSFLSGLAEPLGAVVAWLLLTSFLGNALRGTLFAAVAGVMVFISFDELLPTAREYGEHHVALYGLTSGMAVMAVTLAVTT